MTPARDKLAAIAEGLRTHATSAEAELCRGHTSAHRMRVAAGDVDQVLQQLQGIDLEGWRSAKEPPAALAPGSGHPVTVMAVIDDPRYRMNGDDPFVDVASWWPADKKWTVTHQVRSDAEADDYPARVIAWRPLLELPPPWSELWA